MSTDSPVAPGQIIADKYRVERVLGQGGMGVVVLAMHTDLDQRVAIKFLNAQALADKEWVGRFQREARAAAKIKSEHVVRVFDVGRLENGAPYMVMEYLEGRDLQDVLNERKRLPVIEAVDYLLQVCEALAEAHALGIIHRDLKPANLFVSVRPDGTPSLKILDFGISKVSSLGNEVTMTNTSAIVGSPLYMSPEQMKASKNVDRRSDVWSLGIILQELVTGTPAYVANTTAELCALVLTSPPTPLSASLADAPEALEALVHKCLERPPEKRFQSVGELALALAQFAPETAKASIDRIARISGAEKRGTPSLTTEKPQPAPPSVVVASQGVVSAAALNRTEVDAGKDATVPTTHPADPVAPPAAASTLASMGAEPPAPTPALASPPLPSASTAAAWGAPTPAPRRKVAWGVIAGGAAAVAVVVGALLIISSMRPPEKSTPDVHAATSAQTPTQPTQGPSAAVAASSLPSIAVTALPQNTAPTPPAAPKDAGVSIKPPTPTTTVKKPVPAPSTGGTAGFGGRN